MHKFHILPRSLLDQNTCGTHIREHWPYPHAHSAAFLELCQVEISVVHQVRGH